MKIIRKEYNREVTARITEKKLLQELIKKKVIARYSLFKLAKKTDTHVSVFSFFIVRV